MSDDPWKQQLEAFGQFIHTQRKLARLSLRDLSDRTEISNAYLSQIERGIHAPSVRVMKSLADAFNISAETMLEQAGFVDEPGGDGPPETKTAQLEQTGRRAPRSNGARHVSSEGKPSRRCRSTNLFLKGRG